jgi:UDP-hydrolysing UDP-N-acetyl-D-glucosamine 2-epimerase
MNTRGTKRRVCFVTGTRAEFGLMRRALIAIRDHPKLTLQTVATGMHLDRRRGRSLDLIARDGFRVDRVVGWKTSDDPDGTAVATGRATGALAAVFGELRSDIVLIAGDRVEAFAAASAAHISGRIVAHVHGGDRALGIVDDSLRHAITKLAHLHFPATKLAAQRIRRMGEDGWRVHRVGSPGIDGFDRDAVSSSVEIAGVAPSRFALLVLHPADVDDVLECRRARMVLRETCRVGFDRVVIVYPNNDPGSGGIVRCWDKSATVNIAFRNLDRGRFLTLLRDAAVLVGNSSSGIIEAASFGTPVVDIGHRQLGRERSRNVKHVEYHPAAIRDALGRIWNRGHPRRWWGINVYGRSGSAGRIASVLATVKLDNRLRRKLIAY